MRTRCATGLRHSPRPAPHPYPSGEPATRVAVTRPPRRTETPTSIPRRPSLVRPPPYRPPSRPVHVPLRQPHRLPLRRRPSSSSSPQRLPPRSQPPLLLPPHLRLPSRDPGRPPHRLPTPLHGQHRTPPQMHQIRPEQQQAGRRPDPEPRSHKPNPAQLHGVQQHESGKYPTPPVDRRRVPPNTRGPPPHRRCRDRHGRRGRGGTGRVDRAAAGHGALTATAVDHPRRAQRPLRHEAFGRVVPANQRGREREQPGGGEDGEEHRGRHPHPSRLLNHNDVIRGYGRVSRNQARHTAARDGRHGQKGQTGCRETRCQRASRPPSSTTSSAVRAYPMWSRQAPSMCRYRGW
jgi:hypothetical protein